MLRYGETPWVDWATWSNLVGQLGKDEASLVSDERTATMMLGIA